MRVAARWQLAARPFRSGIAKRGMAKSGEGDGDGDGRRWTAQMSVKTCQTWWRISRTMDDRWMIDGRVELGGVLFLVKRPVFYHR